MSDGAPILFAIEPDGAIIDRDGAARALLEGLPEADRGRIDAAIRDAGVAARTSASGDALMPAPVTVTTPFRLRWRLSLAPDPGGAGSGRLLGALVPADTPDRTRTGVAIFDKVANRLIYTNAAFETLFGVDPDGRPWSDNIVDPTEPSALAFERAIRSDRPFAGVVTARNQRTGRVFPARLAIHLVEDWATGAPRYFFGLCRDCSEERERMADLNATIEVERAAHAEKSAFLRAISHDLRQPVFALGLLSKAARPILADARPELAESLMQSVAGLRRMMESLFEMGALNTRELVPKGERICFDHLFEAAVSEAALCARERGIRLRIGASDAALRSDPVLIARMLRNLLTNAIEHARATVITLDARRTADGAVLTVTDDGIGVPEAAREAIFDDFVQVDGSGQGLGLGLRIVADIAVLLGGTVVHETPAAGGSAFVVTLADLPDPTTEVATRASA